MKTSIFIAGLLCLFVTFRCGATPDYLQQCRDRQVMPLQERFVILRYQEHRQKLYHSPEPWQTMDSRSTGRIYCNTDNFLQSDTITRKDKHYVSVTQLSGTELLLQPYWQKAPVPITYGMIADQPLETARYSPVMLLDYAAKHQPAPDVITDPAFAVYTLTINRKILRLFIRRRDALLERITIMQHDDMLGDVTTTITYRNFTRYEQLYYAQNIEIEKMQGIRDSVTVSVAGFADRVEPFLAKPEGYTIGEEEEEEAEPQVVVKKIANNLYTIDLLHVDTKVMLVEFRDFLLVIDAPLTSANGELILREAEKAAPGKPVRYYAFGHHHAWYLGGVRPFIHRGTTVLCRRENIDYVTYIAEAPRTLQPDSLHLYPRPLVTQQLDSVTTITDGSFEMKIFFIGAASQHTNDYVLFYFPSERLVFEDDLAWLPAEGPLPKAGVRQVALYQAIRKLGIDVATIIQAWPVGGEYNVRSLFSFEALEQTVQMQQQAE